MVADYVPMLLVIAVLATFALQLWTGIAFVWSFGDYRLLHRVKNPGPYWFVMILQALLFIGTPLLVTLMRAFSD